MAENWGENARLEQTLLSLIQTQFKVNYLQIFKEIINTFVTKAIERFSNFLEILKFDF